MSEIRIRRGEDWPEESGWYVCYISGVTYPDVCWCNRRDKHWSRDSIRVRVTHYEDRRLKERRDVF
jgi:hypothetical protein